MEKLLLLLNHDVRQEQTANSYNDQLKSRAEKRFKLSFKIHCEKCGFTDVLRISNYQILVGNMATSTQLSIKAYSWFEDGFPKGVRLPLGRGGTV